MAAALDQYTSTLVRDLVRAINRYRISISALPVNDKLEASALREVVVGVEGVEYHCLADNEYGDMDRDNLPLQLNMILMEFDAYEIAEDLQDWAADHDLDASEAYIRDMWGGLRENAREIIAILGQDIEPVSAWDLQHGSGDIQQLRDLPPAYARPDLYPYAFEVWLKPYQVYKPTFLKIYAGEFCRVTGESQTGSDNLELYADLQKTLQREGWELATDTVYPETEEGIKTGQSFDYWITPDPENPHLFILGSTPGEPLAVRLLYPESQSVVEFDTHEDAHFALWDENAKNAFGRVSFEGDFSHEPETSHENGRGFRVDMSILMFAVVLFFGGLMVFGLLVEWTGIENFHFGSLMTTIGSIYCVIKSFSRIT